MKTCFACGLETVNPEEPPRYDVLNPSYVPSEDMSAVGPYCADCWPETYTSGVTNEPL